MLIHPPQHNDFMDPKPSSVIIQRVYDDVGQAMTYVRVGRFSLLIDGHTLEVDDKRLQPLWEHLGLTVVIPPITLLTD